MANIVQRTQYYPFGLPFADAQGRNLQPYTYNGKENDSRLQLNLMDYMARQNNNQYGRFTSMDPLAEKYYSISPYAYVMNNLINNIDPDGRDIVFVTKSGAETVRIKSTEIHSTYIMKNISTGSSVSMYIWSETAMPGIIQERTQSGENTSGTMYQANDHQIAASVGYFNEDKNTGNLSLYTEGGNPIPQDAIKAMPDLDPTLVKAITIQESNAGVTGVKDVMQSNVKGDWSSLKEKYGLTKGQEMSVPSSLNAGIKVLGTKGFKGGVTYDTKTGESTYKFQGWDNATKAYNGGGTKNYQQNVYEMWKESKKPAATNY